MSSFDPRQHRLINCGLKPFKLAIEQNWTLPRISFWGLHKYLLNGSSLKPALFPEFAGSRPGNQQRLDLMSSLFYNTPLDLFHSEHPFFAEGEADGTVQNHCTWLWNHYWGMPVPDKEYQLYGCSEFPNLVSRFPYDPALTLDGITKNIQGLIPPDYPNRKGFSDATQELLEDLFPARAQAIREAEPERRLALLAVIALLGMDAIRGEGLWAWLAGRVSNASPIPTSVFSPGRGIYSSADREIVPWMLPDLGFREESYSFSRAKGSPLYQILGRNPDCRRLLLCGQSVSPLGGTTVSGAGKTTSLRYLCMEPYRDRTTVFLPLTDVYSPHALHYPDNLERYLRKHYQLELGGRQTDLCLLLDGLDELVNRDGLERLCGDLDELCQRDDITLVVSSKQPPERLPRFETLSQWSLMWQEFLPCFLQPMTSAQRRTAVQDSPPDPDLLDMLNTPFLLSLYRTTEQCSADPRSRALLRRWGLEERFRQGPNNATELFYCSLVAQLVRWFEANKGTERQSEVDAFLLFHTLPAIAFQMVLNEACEGKFHPAAGMEIDQAYVSRMIRLSLEGTRQGLRLFPGYGNNPQLAASLHTLQADLDYDHFLSGQVPSLFRADWGPGEDPFQPQRAEFRFANHSLRDYLASLHIANIFLMAQNDCLPDREELTPFYGCTLEYLLPTFAATARNFLLVLVGSEEGETDLLLRTGLPPFQTRISHLLAYCTAVQIRQAIFAQPWGEYQRAWIEGLIQLPRPAAPDELFPPESLLSRHYLLSYIFAEIAACRQDRETLNFVRASTHAGLVCKLQKAHPEVLTSEGQHMQAMVWLKKMGEVYNLSSRYSDALKFGKSLWLGLLFLPEDSTIADEAFRLSYWHRPSAKTPPTGPYRSILRGGDLDLADDLIRFPWLETAEDYPSLRQRVLAEPPQDVSPERVQAALRPVYDILASLRRMAAGADMHQDPVFPDPAPETAELAPIFLMMLEKGLLRWKAYEEKDFFGHSELQFLCLQSLRAKACSIYSACAPGASGAALNQLGCFLENQQEAFENDPRLPFFRANPQLHLDLPDLEYDAPLVNAFRVSRRVYGIRRGQQPYSARKLAELLLRRQVRLDEQGQPAPCTPDVPFTQTELDFLEEATTRAASIGGTGPAYWRLRYLQARASWLGVDTPDGQHLLQQARQALQTAWSLHGCNRRLDQDAAEVDLYAALLAAESLALNAHPGADWVHRYARLTDFYQRKAQELTGLQTFVTTIRLLESHLKDGLDRLLWFGALRNEPLLRNYFHPPKLS